MSDMLKTINRNYCYDQPTPAPRTDPQLEHEIFLQTEKNSQIYL